MSDMFGSIVSLAENERNINFQKGANAMNLFNGLAQWNYNKQLNQTIMDREDNAIQRRVADLKKAGISPIYALGAGAGSGGTVSSQKSAPQVTAPVSNGVSRAFEIMMQKEMTTAQVKNLEAQNANIVEQNNLLKAQVDEAKERAKGQRISNSVEQYEFDLARGRGSSTRLNGNPVAGGVDALTNTLMPGLDNSTAKRFKSLNLKTTPNGVLYLFSNPKKRDRALEELGLDKKKFSWNGKYYFQHRAKVIDKMLSYE